MLKHPAWYSDTILEQTTLPLRVHDYDVTPAVGRDGRWTVTSSKGQTVYCRIEHVTVSAD